MSYSTIESFVSLMWQLHIIDDVSLDGFIADAWYGDDIYLMLKDMGSDDR